MAKLLKAYYDFRGGWNADAAPENLADNELMQADNCVLLPRGGLAKRQGVIRLNSASYGAEVEQLIEWPRDSGARILLAVIGDKLCRIAEDGSKEDLQTLQPTHLEEWFYISPGLAIAVYRCAVGYFHLQDKFYFVDGAEYRLYDGAAVRPVQLEPPSAAPAMAGSGSGTGLAAGTYKGKVVFLNADGVESPASLEGSVTITAGQQIDWSAIPIGPTGTVGRRLYRTTVGGALFKRLADINDNTTTTYTDSTPDADLGAAMVTDNDLAPIKRCKFTLRHPRSFRIFAAGDSQDPAALYFSEPNNPAYFKATSKMYPTTGDGPITGLALFGDAVLVFFQNSIWAYRGVDPATDATWSKLPVGQGTVSSRSIALTPNSLTYLGSGGLYAISPALFDYDITLAPGEQLVRNLAKDRVTTVIQGIAHPRTACAIFDSARELYMLAYGDDPSFGYNNRVLVLDWGLGAFTRYTGWRVNDFCLRLNGDLLIGGNGYILKANQGYRDIDLPIPFVVRTKALNLDYPVHRKKTYRLFLAALQELSAVRAKIDTEYDSVFYSIVPLNESFVWGDEWGKIWGWNDYASREMKCRLQGQRFRVTLENANIDESVTIYGLAFEYKVKKPKAIKVSQEPASFVEWVFVSPGLAILIRR